MIINVSIFYAGYTSAQLLTICGGSNGGLLTAAVSNQFPADIGAAIVQVG